MDNAVENLCAQLSVEFPEPVLNCGVAGQNHV